MLSEASAIESHSLDVDCDIDRGNSYVVKRSGMTETVDISKIKRRVSREAKRSPALAIDTFPVEQEVVNNLASGITTEQLDQVAITTASGLESVHPDYGVLASRI